MRTARDLYNASDFMKVLFVGDIQTAQPYGKPNWTDWVQRALWENGELQVAWRRQVLNTAVARATPKHVSTYFMHYIGQYKPDAVVVSFGVSRMYPHFDEKDFLSEMNALLDVLQRLETTVILWSPYPLLGGVNREVTLTMGAGYKQLAVARNLQFVDIYHDFEDIELAKIFTYKVMVNNELFEQQVGGIDGITLNEIGQYIVAKRMAGDLFRIALPEADTGTFRTPNLDTVKRWS